MKRKEIRWGIIGAGRIAHTFCRDASLVNAATLVAVASRDATNAQAFARQYDISSAYSDYDELFNDPNVDAVYVATPHNFHYEHCRRALMAGKHVLCEKPFTVSSKECKQLHLLAEASQLFLMEAMWTYFLPAIQRAKSWVESGKIGELVQINADFGYPIEYSPDKREYDVNLYGGCLFEMGVYPIGLSQFFMQSSPENIDAIGRFAPNGVENDIVMLFEYNGMTSRLATSFRARLPNYAFIIGTEGYIKIPDFFRASKCSFHVLDEQREHFSDDRRGEGFEFQIAHVCEAIFCGNTQSSIMPLSTSFAIQKQIERVFANLKKA